MTTTEPSLEKSATNGIRTALGVGGVLAIVAGIILLWQPAGAAKFVTGVLAVYAIAVGLVYLGLGIFSKERGGWSRVGHILLGLLFVVAGVVAFANLGPTAASLVLFVAIFIGVSWIVEGIVSLSTLGLAASKGWTIFFAIVSILAGLYLVISPLAGVVVLWWVLAASLIAIGVLNVIRAITFGKA